MAERARHAFGTSENVSAALQNGKIDAYDILFLDGDTDPKVGWIDKNGAVKIVSNEKADLSGIESELATKANAEEVRAELETKADVVEVDEKINTAVSSTVTTANAYTDERLEAALGDYLAKKYEITNKPEGTLVNYRDKEIRVMCPVNTKWVKQNVGETGNANMYYMGFKAYAPEGAAGFKEGDQGVIIDKYFDFESDYAGTDENGRNYSICWLALASYNEATDTWTYFGKNSTKDKYIGWTYVVDWYNANGVVIASDSVRINLSNENCHSSIEPYYVGDIMKEVDAKIAEVAEASSYEIIEF